MYIEKSIESKVVSPPQLYIHGKSNIYIYIYIYIFQFKV